MPAVLTLVMVTSAEMMVIVAWSETSELYLIRTRVGPDLDIFLICRNVISKVT